jgi:hypothetical protein
MFVTGEVQVLVGMDLLVRDHMHEAVMDIGIEEARIGRAHGLLACVN